MMLHNNPIQLSLISNYHCKIKFKCLALPFYENAKITNEAYDKKNPPRDTAYELYDSAGTVPRGLRNGWSLRDRGT